MRSGIARELAQREMDGRRALLEQRRKIMEQVFSARRRNSALTRKAGVCSPAANLCAQSLLCLQKEGTVILLRRKTPHQQQIAEAFGQPCRFETDPTIRIGGLRAYNSAMGIMATKVGRHAGGSARLVRRKLWIDAGRITVAATRRKGMIQT
ncbi:MAG: hypothetical protein ACLS8R_00755 [Anaeromassilibacillus sp.]